MLIETMVKSFIYSRRKGIDGAKAKCAEGTIKIYERHLSTFNTWLMTDAQVTRYENITRNHMRAYLEFLEGRCKSGLWAESTNLQMLRSLRTFFHWVERDEECVEEGLHAKRLHRYLPVIPQGEPRKDIPQKLILRNSACRSTPRHWLALETT
jgi:site-specific recombinase XerD